jgi:hypothetical protein
LLEHLLDPKTVSDGEVRRVLGLFFDSIFPAAPTAICHPEAP